MIAFLPSNFCVLVANLLLLSKISSSLHPKRLGDPRSSRFTDLAKRLEDEFQAVPAGAESLQPQPMTVFRLPPHQRPRSYALKIVIDKEEMAFSGEVRINVSVSQNSHSLLLHSHRLQIDHVALYYKNDEQATSFLADPANQLLTIRSNSTLSKDEVYQIQVKFRGRMNTEFRGIYRSATVVGSKTIYNAVTQFEPTDARQAFPCFDEPHFRATFDIRVARYQHEVALSNMPVISTSTPDPSVDNRVWNTFDTTPPMPTYLVAIVVAEDFAYIADPSQKYKLWAAKDTLTEYSYAHSELVETVKLVENYTGIEYILPHLNIVAVEDFYRGAMENWGLMTFKSNTLRYKKNQDKYPVLVIVVHETIHQWFGNYVTISWWDALWLKEGIATLLSYVVGATVDPDAKMGDRFLYEIKFKVMEVDGILEKTAMTHPVNTPAEIDEQFNAVNYEKAASVLHMLRFMVSPDTFQKALRIYLRTGYTVGGGVTSPDDLWAAFDQQLFLENRNLGNGLTVGQTMKSWTHQVGYPIIMVSRYSKGSRDDIGFKQEQFNAFHEAAANVTYEWTVPLTCTKGSNPNFDDTRPKLWLRDKKEVILPNEVGKDEWIVCNVQQTGYYRLNYDEKSWRLIAEVLHSSPEQIHRYNRQQIIYDVIVLLPTQKVPHTSALKIIRSLDRENDVLVWGVAIPMVEALLWQFEGTKAYEGLRQFLEKRFDQIYKRIGFYEKSTDTRDTRELRPQILRIFCQLGNTDCLSKAAAEFNQHDTIDRIPSYSQYAAIAAALKSNSSSDLTWKKLRRYFENQENPRRNADLSNSFRSLTDESIIKKFLSNLSAGKSDEFQKYSLQISLDHHHGMMAAMHFIQEMLPNMSEHRASESTINAILKAIPVKSPEQMDLLNEMLETARKLDSKKYQNVIKTLTDKKHEAEARVKALDEFSTQILAALDSIGQDPLLDTKISYGSLHSSAAKSSYSHPTGCLISTYIPWLLATSTRLIGN